MVIQQRAQRIAGIQETFSVFHIRTRQQHLPDVNAVDGEQLFPELYESALSHGGQQLFGSDRRGEFGVAGVHARRQSPRMSQLQYDALRHATERTDVQAQRYGHDSGGAIRLLHTGTEFYHQRLAVTHDSLPFNNKGK